MYKICLLIVLLLSSALQAQRISSYTITSASANYNNESVQGSWTIGDIAQIVFNNDDARVSLNHFNLSRGNYITHSIPSINNDFVLYPNPATDFITVQWKLAPHEVKYQLFDINGATNTQWRMSNMAFGHIIDISSLSPGIYFLLINQHSNEGQPTIQKILKH